MAGIFRLICSSGRVSLSVPFNFLICISVLVLLCFLRCVHTFFNEFALSKRDKQVKPSGHLVSLEAQSDF